MQLQLYGFGSVMSWILFSVEAFSDGGKILQFEPHGKYSSTVRLRTFRNRAVWWIETPHISEQKVCCGAVHHHHHHHPHKGTSDLVVSQGDKYLATPPPHPHPTFIVWKTQMVKWYYAFHCYFSVDNTTIWMLTIFAITMSMTSGIATAAIVKRLDNIVKLYTQVTK